MRLQFKMIGLLHILSLFLLTSLAFAAPNLINYQGVLTDSVGAPINNASQQMTFRLYDAETAGNLLWEELRTVDVANGSYNLLLGSVEPLDSQIFDLDELWLEVVVASEILEGRQRLASVPYALQADRVAPGAVAPSDLVASCGEGEILVQISGVWTCTTYSPIGCNPGDSVNCYTGAPATQGVGPCSTGVRTCDPQGNWNACSDEVLPTTEICDGLDNDCNRLLDDVPGSPLWYPDADNDGFGVATGASPFCAAPPAGFVDNTLDCDDANAERNPLLREVCGDGIDNDCDSLVDPVECSPPGSCPFGALAVVAENMNMSGTCFSECFSNPLAPACISCQTVATGYDSQCVTDAILADMCIINNSCATSDLSDIVYQCVSTFCATPYTTAFGPIPRDCVSGTSRDCGSNVGSCQFGAEACVDGSWSGTCLGGVGPVTEICADGLDNDCSGVADDFCDPPILNNAYFDIEQNRLVLTFDLPIDPGSVLADASQFSFSNSLTASAASAVDNQIFVSLDNPAHAQVYAVSVADTVTSASGIAIDMTPFPAAFNVVLADGSPCDDGNPCTQTDTVVEAVCAGIPLDCSQLDSSCTLGSCHPETGICYAEAVADGSPCNDGDACSESDVCGAGSCVGVAVICDDGVACTADSCDPVSGCQSIPDDVSCDDGDVCTTETCDEFAGCVYTPISCDDGNLCTLDSCNPNDGCVFSYLPSGYTCGLGNEVCDGLGVCQPGIN